MKMNISKCNFAGDGVPLKYYLSYAAETVKAFGANLKLDSKQNIFSTPPTHCLNCTFGEFQN